jgi:hypothetical protein
MLRQRPRVARPLSTYEHCGPKRTFAGPTRFATPHVIFTMAIAMRFRGFELKVCRRAAQRTGPTSGTEIRKFPIGDFKNRGALRALLLGWTLRCLALDLVRPLALDVRQLFYA